MLLVLIINLYRKILEHKNVLKLFGISMNPPCIVTGARNILHTIVHFFPEYLPQGDLASLLYSKVEISNGLKLKFLEGIASGMHHLAVQGIVHRQSILLDKISSQFREGT